MGEAVRGPSRRSAAGCLMAAGVMWIIAGLVPPRLLPLEPVWMAMAWPVAGGGVLVVLVGAAGLLDSRVPGSALMALGVALGSLLMVLVVAEVGCRQAGLDFAGEEAAQRRFPPYYRSPRVPSGTVFYRREGPESWTGQPIRTWLALSDNPASEVYRNEATFTVRYDAQGFRGEEATSDWEVAVAGDSFVELGCVPHGGLFTTVLAGETGWRVRNLGVSNTGPLTHLHYLEAYGVAPSLRRVVVVFYEGNDLQDLAWERQALEHHARTGKRGSRALRRQSSLMGALHDAYLRPPRHRGPSEAPSPEHLFASREGAVRVTLPPFAPDPAELRPEVLSAWEDFLARYRAWGERGGLELWLAYMPVKARVLAGRVQPVDPAVGVLEGWTPTALPAWVEEGCRRHGIRFVDLTPALRHVAQEEGECPYNPMVETHLNASGSRTVGQELARHLGRRNGESSSAGRGSQPPGSR